MPDPARPKLDLNTADADALVRLLRIDRRLAGRIIALRPFRSGEDLQRVWGMDASTRQRLLSLVTVGSQPPVSEETASPVPPEATTPAAPAPEMAGPEPALPPSIPTPAEPVEQRAHPRLRVRRRLQPHPGSPTRLTAEESGRSPGKAASPPPKAGSAGSFSHLPLGQAPAGPTSHLPPGAELERRTTRSPLPPGEGGAERLGVREGSPATPITPGLIDLDAEDGPASPADSPRPSPQPTFLVSAPAPRTPRQVLQGRLLLVAILLVSAYFRFVGLNWDENRHQHPDERFITMVAEQIRPVGSLAEYFETDTSTLNPLRFGSYTYGMLPLFVTRTVAEWTGQTTYDSIVLVGRALSGVFDLAVVLLLYFLGRMLYSRRVGLLAAALYGAAVLPIQLSHYLAVDSFSTVFVVASLLLVYKAIPLKGPLHQPEVLQPAPGSPGWVKNRLHYFALFGLSVGMAMACKVNTAPVFGVILLAAAVHLITNRQALLASKNPSRWSELRGLAGGLLLAAAAAFLAFRIFQPYAFMGPGFFGLRLNPQWLSVIKEVADQVAGKSEWPPNHHWTTRPASYGWTNMVLWGLGFPLGLASWAGLAWALWRTWKGDGRRHLLLAAWILAYFVWQNAQFWRYMRYFMPIYPVIVLLGAWGLLEAWDRTAESRQILWERLQAVLPAKRKPLTRPSRPRLGSPSPEGGGKEILLSMEEAYGQGISPLPPGEGGPQGRVREVLPSAGQPRGILTILPGGLSAAALGIVLVGTLAYAFAFTRIYTHPITRIEASRWMLEHIPAPLNVVVESPGGGERAYPVATTLNRALVAGQRLSYAFRPQETGTLRRLSLPRPQLAAFDIHLRLSQDAGAAEVIAEGHHAVKASEGSEAAPTALEIRLPDVTLEAGQPYFLHYTIHTAGPLSTGLLSLGSESPDQPGLPLDWNPSIPSAGRLEGVVELAPQTTVHLNRLHIGEFYTEPGPISTYLELTVARDHEGNEGLSRATWSTDLGASPAAAQIELPPAELLAGETYYLIYKVTSGGPLLLEGETLALETSWDDALPLSVDGYDPLGGMYAPLNLELYEPDTPEKRERMISILEQARYLVIPSNRSYDAMPRLPLRYPLTLRYYQLLFDCACDSDAMEARAYSLQPPFHSPLGFDLVAAFDHPIDFGLFSISDLSADEAFTVYDHPKVMVFEKSAGFSAENVRRLLDQVDLSLVLEQAPLAYSRTPTGLRVPADRLQAQQSGGTWSDRFDPQAPVNRSDGMAVVSWYLLLLVLGWVAFPLVFTAWRGLADRGYAFARLAALLFVAWLAWILGSLELLPFTQATLWGSVAVLGLASAGLGWRNREQLAGFIRLRGRHLLVLEGVFLVLFLAALAVRLGNPDLWNPWLGGEKPMEFSIFNAVLKAVYFPPHNPWFAGHYLNYYYYGYVVAAVPTRLVGVLPSIAFNLVLPTWFAMAGVGAFSLAHHLALRMLLARSAGSKNAEQSREPVWKQVTVSSLSQGDSAAREGSRILPSPLPHRGRGGGEGLTPDMAIGQPGPGQAPRGQRLQDQEAESADSDGWNEWAHGILHAGGEPSAPALAATGEGSAGAVASQEASRTAVRRPGSRTPAPGMAYLAGVLAVIALLALGNLDQMRKLVRYLPEVGMPGWEIQSSVDRGLAALRGAGQVLSGQAELPGGKGRWYFEASRPILHEGPDTPIAEFPLFSFLYGDLHPHLLAMPVLLAVLAWIAGLLTSPPPGASVPGGSSPEKRWPERIAFWLAGALAIGMLQPAHTWDYPSMLGLAGAAIVWEGLRGEGKPAPAWSRRTLARIAGRLLLLAALTWILYRPFSVWFATAYSSVELWKGARTPLDDYLAVHGLFLFILVSYLTWLSAPWLRRLFTSRQPGGGRTWIPEAALAAAGLGYLLWVTDYQAFIVGLPLLAWTLVLLFARPGPLVRVEGLAHRLVLALYAAGLGVTLLVEVIVLRGDVGRANMVMRYYNQAWVFFSLASGVALAGCLLPALRQNPGLRGRRVIGWQAAWGIGLTLLVLSAAAYPLTAVRMKVADRWPGIQNPPYRLDGMAYMLGERIPTPDRPAIYDDGGHLLYLAVDYAAIRWLQENVDGTPTIVEGNTSEYRWGSRVSIYTGLPTVAGWSWHVRQHNSLLEGSVIEQRIEQVHDFYNTPDPAEAIAFLQRYQVEYVVVGGLERALYAPEGMAKFIQLEDQGVLDQVFSFEQGQDRIAIYQVVPGTMAAGPSGEGEG